MEEFNMKRWLAYAGVAVTIVPVICLLAAWGIWQVKIKNGTPRERPFYEEEY